MQQIQSSASSVTQSGNMPNMSTAGNMRNPTVAGNVNGSMMNQSGLQQNINSAGMPFNSGTMSSMMNSGKLHLFSFASSINKHRYYVNKNKIQTSALISFTRWNYVSATATTTATRKPSK